MTFYPIPGKLYWFLSLDGTKVPVMIIEKSSKSSVVPHFKILWKETICVASIFCLDGPIDYYRNFI